jgi:hypothetical protein
MFHAPSLPTTATGARRRAAVSSPSALKPNPPSPAATSTGDAGRASFAATPRGISAPGHPERPARR